MANQVQFRFLYTTLWRGVNSINSIVQLLWLRQRRRNRFTAALLHGCKCKNKIPQNISFKKLQSPPNHAFLPLLQRAFLIHKKLKYLPWKSKLQNRKRQNFDLNKYAYIKRINTPWNQTIRIFNWRRTYRIYPPSKSRRPHILI